jgi:hypothetical protein
MHVLGQLKSSIVGRGKAPSIGPLFCGWIMGSEWSAEFPSPRRLVTNSEVATMAYSMPDPFLSPITSLIRSPVRPNSKIPVPKVLDWSDETNPTVTKYIFMEHVSGVRLHRKWPSMNTHQHMLCVKSLAKLVQEMANLSFSAYRSLYFSDAPIDPTSRIDFVEGFCIGPHRGAPAWPHTPDELHSHGERMPYRGPCEFIAVPGTGWVNPAGNWLG